MEEKIKEVIIQARNEQIFPGCVVGIRADKREYVVPFGRLTYENGAQEVTEETVYDVASITKAIPTSSLALLLIDQKKISLDEKVIRYIPELAIPQKEEIMIWHLLTHTLDFDLRLSHEKDLSSQEMWQKILSSPLKRRPGTTYAYTNATSIILGHLIERVSGKSLDIFAQEIFFHPLQMTDTTFHPSTLLKKRVAPSEIDEWRGREIRGEVHDESAYVLRNKMVVGSAGLFSTVPDLMHFLRMLLQKGISHEKRFFSEKMIEMMATNQIPHLDEETGLGWELNQPWYMGKCSTSSTIGKTGFTGCHVMVDFKKDRALVLLSNSTYPKRPETKNKMHAVRRKLADIVFQ